MTFGADERALTDWLERNARVAWLACDEPWRMEKHLIRNFSLSLNLTRTGTMNFIWNFRTKNVWRKPEQGGCRLFDSVRSQRKAEFRAKHGIRLSLWPSPACPEVNAAAPILGRLGGATIDYSQTVSFGQNQLGVTIQFCYRSSMSCAKVVTAAIIRTNGFVLLARRSSGQNLAGFWEFPGGKVEDGETSEECLARELQEELGIQTIIGRKCAESSYQYDHGTFRIVAYFVEWLAGDLRPRVHDRVEWVKFRDLGEYQLLPADDPIAVVVQNLED
jgi:8-oxo-dGTP diphosphatase